MSDSIGLLIAFALPVAVLTLLRINAVMVFLSLCLGQVLVQFVGEEANTMLNLFSSQAPGVVSKSALHVALLLLPVALTSIFMLFSVQGRGKLVLNVLPAAAAAGLGVLLVEPLLSPGLRHTIEAGPAWHQFTNAQALIVGAGAIVSLFFLWMQRASAHAKRGRER